MTDLIIIILHEKQSDIHRESYFDIKFFSLKFVVSYFIVKKSMQVIKNG